MNAPTQSKKRGRGRPETPLLERMRVILWSLHVIAFANFPYSKGLDEMFRDGGARWGLTKGQWSRYLRGDAIPQGAKSNLQASLVQRMELTFHGTARTFNHPIWRLLDFDTLLGPDDLRECVHELDPYFYDDFFYKRGECPERLQPQELNFWLRPSPDRAALLLMYPEFGLDGAAACLIEARLGYLAQDAKRYVTGLRAAAKCLHPPEEVISELRGQKAKSVLLTMEGICLLHALLTLEKSPRQFDNLKGPRSVVLRWYDGWSDRSLMHSIQLTRPAQRVYQMWNGKLTRYSGLLR